MKKRLFSLIFIFVILFLITGCGSSSKEQESKDDGITSNMLYPHLDSKTGLYGFINVKGEYIIEPKYSKTNGFDKDMTMSLVSVDGDYSVYINKDGKNILDDEFATLYSTNFKNGYAKVSMWDPVERNHKYGVINKNGEYVIELSSKYIDMSDIGDNGYVAVTQSLGNLEYRDGYIDINTNEFIIDEEDIEDYYEGKAFLNGYGLVKTGEYYPKRYTIINEKGETVLKTKYVDITPINKNGYAFYQETEDGNYGILNVKDNSTTETKYEKAYPFNDNNRAFVKIDGSYTLINEKGETITDDLYSDATKFNDNGIALVAKDGKYGSVDDNGKVITKPKYDSYISLADGSWIIELDGKQGIMDATGKVVVEPF